MEILYRSSPVRCHELLCMQRHVFTRLCYELMLKDYLRDSQYTCVIHEQFAMLLLTKEHNCQFFFCTRCLSIFQWNGQPSLSCRIMRLSGDTMLHTEVLWTRLNTNFSHPLEGMYSPSITYVYSPHLISLLQLTYFFLLSWKYYVVDTG